MDLFDTCFSSLCGHLSVPAVQMQGGTQRPQHTWESRDRPAVYALRARLELSVSLNLFQFDYNPQFADWSKETRGAPLISVKPLDNWLLIYTRRNYEAANSLIQNLFKVTPAMGIQMKKAIM